MDRWCGLSDWVVKFYCLTAQHAVTIVEASGRLLLLGRALVGAGSLRPRLHCTYAHKKIKIGIGILSNPCGSTVWCLADNSTCSGDASVAYY